MELNQALAFGSGEEINNEIRRRALCLTQSNTDVRSDEDPQVIAAREVFEELLSRYAALEQCTSRAA